MEVDTIIDQDTSIQSLSSEDLKKAMNGEIESEEETVDPEKKEEKKEKSEEKTTEEPEKEKSEEDIKSKDTESLQKTIDDLKKKSENAEKLISRMGTELGLLRKENPEDTKEEIQRLRELHADDAVEGTKQINAFLKKQEDAKGADTDKIIKERCEQTKEIIIDKIPEFEGNIDALADIVAEDGCDDKTVKDFKKYPYMLDPTILFNLSKRFELKGQITSLTEENTTLKAEIETLKKKPGKIIDLIKSGSSRTTLTGKSGQGKQKETDLYQITKPVTSMSQEEIDKVLKDTS